MYRYIAIFTLILINTPKTNLPQLPLPLLFALRKDRLAQNRTRPTLKYSLQSLALPM